MSMVAVQFEVVSIWFSRIQRAVFKRLSKNVYQIKVTTPANYNRRTNQNS